ncbi:MAG: ketoacyl-ACP synthase III [Lactobacillales bacterium]|jgi:3-oxoacyl-[acyl-carrier-protein] synthase-3|nr:ketoacyl-ACP synthase III [Lactobacillales bacterium]
MIRSVIKGVGGYLPEKILTNRDLEKMVDTSDSWIVERTGIHSRHVAAKGELTSDLAYKAALVALENAGLAAQDADCIIVATTTPDETLPATATKVQNMLGMTRGFAFDVQAVCSGFMYALSIADNFIKTGMIKTAVVIGAETITRLVDWTDRNTCVLFGDGAGAVVLQAAQGKGDISDTGILNVILHSDGRQYDMLKTTGGASATQSAGVILMEGKEVFRHAVTNLAAVAKETLSALNLTESDVDVLVPHQANIRIIEGTAKKLSLPIEKVILTLPDQGNTSAASIPLALFEGVKSGRIKKGDLMLLEAMGGGFTWAGGLIRF